jgi:hypothetical protein
MRPDWVPPRIQMIFQVSGGYRQAMVSTEAVKERGKTQFSLIAVDVLAKPGDKPASGSVGPAAGGPLKTHLILVEGSEERLKVRGQLRGFLQLERVDFIDQSIPDNEDDNPIETMHIKPVQTVNSNKY